ncbi:hypothetical protein ST47_g8052 [Ascochyta rabiei]|uniref:SnoaL-like domain-containing protein n=1 Tax=Didymella rabiei TaxID=5454 RepID=A0A162ZUC4_DIDRA|nr:hypothetical protein ST47_g8052 [Ascochyta rabiei]
MAPTRDTLLDTASKYISIETIDETSFRAIRTSTCITHCITPSFRSSHTNEEIIKRYPTLRTILKNIKFAVIDERHIIVDEATRKVVLNLRQTSETTVGPFENESVTILVMNRSGTLIDEIYIFLDSLRYIEFANRLDAAQASHM